MKKKLLLVVLALAILTSLTAGTLAVYTKTLDDTEQIEAKRFTFNFDGSISGGSAINLAPTESMEYDFIIANVDEKGGSVAEIPLQFDVTIDYKDAFDTMPGLKATLYDKSGEVGEYSDGMITYSAQSEANKPFDNDYKVILTWEDNGDDEGQTDAGEAKATFEDGLSLVVVASQVVPK